MATEIFKALHGSTPIYIRDLFEEKDKIYNLRSTVSQKQPKCNMVTYGLNSFRYKGAKIWNDLPNKLLLVIEYSRVNSFLLIFFSFKCTLPTLNTI